MATDKIPLGLASVMSSRLVVTNRLANMHDELMRLMEQPPALAFPGEAPLYAAAYRPARRDSVDQIDCWPFAQYRQVPQFGMNEQTT